MFKEKEDNETKEDLIDRDEDEDDEEQEDLILTVENLMDLDDELNALEDDEDKEKTRKYKASYAKAV